MRFGGSSMLAGFLKNRLLMTERPGRLCIVAGAGPGVVVMHEIPGLHPGVAAFATRVTDAGFSVAMPVMFGTVGKPVSTGYILEQVLHVCISREFRAAGGAVNRARSPTGFARFAAACTPSLAGKASARSACA